MGYYEGEVGSLVGGNSNNGYDGFGGWWGIIALIAVAAIFGGGWGFGGYGGGAGGGAAMQGALTREQACIDNNFQNLMRETAGISDAVGLGFANLNSTICNQQYDTAQMINAMNVSNLQSFNAANIANLQSTNAIQTQLANCCCTVERGLDRLSCEAASNTGAIIAAGQANTQRILDYLCTEKISALQAENAQLNAQISNQATANYIVNTLRPFPTASYQVPNPFTGSYGFGYNNGFGCSCGC